MKLLIALAAALILGMAGLILFHESGGGGSGSATSAGSQAKIATISTGEEVEIEAHLASDGFTIVEFTADW